MPDQEDIQTGDSAADFTGETGVDTGAADQTPAAEENAQVEAFKAKAEDEVAKRQAAEEDIRRLNEQILVLSNPPQIPERPKDVFDGMEGYEPITVEQARQIRQESQQQTQQLLTNLQVNSFINATSDFSEIVGTYQQGRLKSAEALKDFIKDNPSMRYLEGLPPTAAHVVYNITKQHKELKELRAKQAAIIEHQTQADVDNKLTPLSPAAVGGGGGSFQGEPTDAQVDEAFERAEAGEFG